MAVFSQDPFGGAVDYGGYLNWEKVTTPDGQVYYVVPGNPGYVYDPVLSNARGRKVFRANPQQQINAQNEAVKAEKERLKQESFIRSPAGQLLPVAGTTAGLIAANYAIRPEAGSSITDQLLAHQQGMKIVDGQLVPITQAQSAGEAAVSGMTRGGGEGSGGGFGGGDTVETDTLPPNSEVMEDGSIVNTETGQVIGRVAQGAMGAYQIFTGIDRFKDDKVGGGLNILSGGANVGAALGSQTAASFAGPLAIASGGYDVYNSLQNGGEGIRSAGATLGAGIGTMILPGLGTIAGAAIGNAAGYGLDKLGIAHKTTKQRTQENYGSLGEIAADNAAYQNLVNQGFQESYGGLDTWDIDDDKTQAPIDLITRGYGVLKEFGPEWAQLSQAQREAVVRGLVDNDLINSKQGDWLVTDSAKAQEVKNNVLGGFDIGVQAANNPKQVTPGQAAAMGLPPRSSTLSPGIGLNGLPITKGPLILGR